MSPATRSLDAWRRLQERVRRENVPFHEHWTAFSRAAAHRPDADGPVPAWTPGPEVVAASNIGRLMADRRLENYRDLHRWSVANRSGFWETAIERLGVIWHCRPDAVLDARSPPERPVWAPGGRLNIVDSCFTAPGDHPAVMAARESAAGTADPGPASYTYDDLRRLVRRVAGGLRRRGLGAGRGVALYMPLTLECVAAYLGIIHAGCRVISVADSFPPQELARRLAIVDTDAVITVDSTVRGGKRLAVYDRVRAAGAPPAVVVPASGPRDLRLRDGDILWQDFLDAAPLDAARPASPDDIINVLFSSGTTGAPKAIPWTQLTPVKCAMDAAFHQDIRPGDVVTWPTNIGWMMGPWLIFAALINRATVALFEGSPGSREFVRFVEQAGATMVGVVPSLVRAWRAFDDDWPADWHDVRTFSSTGEPSAREDSLWLMSRTRYRAPIIEYCGGTEIGGGYVTGTVVQPASPGTFTTPALGLDLLLLDGDGRPVEDGRDGEVYLVPPSIGLSQRLLNGDHHAVYHAGVPTGPGGEVLRRHGDRMRRLPGGCYRAQGRADDTMNLGGIKVGSLEIERALAGHPGIASCAAVGVQPEGEGGEKLVVYVVPAGDPAVAREAAIGPQLAHELSIRLRKQLNPLFHLHDVVIVDALPYTASGKLRRTDLRQRYQLDRGRTGGQDDEAPE